MAATFYIKRNDHRPPIEAALKQANGAPINLEHATVKFIMSNDAGIKVEAPAQIIDATNGVVKYDWQEGDTDTAGSYQAEFEITFQDEDLMTVPNAEYIIITILSDLG